MATHTHLWLRLVMMAAVCLWACTPRPNRLGIPKPPAPARKKVPKLLAMDGSGKPIAIPTRKGVTPVFLKAEDSLSEPIWTFQLARLAAADPTEDGGAVGLGWMSSEMSVFRIDSTGRLRWSHEIKGVTEERVGQFSIRTLGDRFLAVYKDSYGWTSQLVSPTGDVLSECDRFGNHLVATNDAGFAWALYPDGVWDVYDSNCSVKWHGTIARSPLGDATGERGDVDDILPQELAGGNMAFRMPHGQLLVHAPDGPAVWSIGTRGSLRIARDSIHVEIRSERGTAVDLSPDGMATPASGPQSLTSDAVAVSDLGPFEQHLSVPIQALAVVGRDRVYARSARHIWKWDGRTWQDTGPVQAQLLPSAPVRGPEGPSLYNVPGGYSVDQLLLGPGNTPWLLGVRATSGMMVPSPEAGLVLRAVGSTWNEIPELQRLLRADFHFNWQAESSVNPGCPHVTAASNGHQALVCGASWCRMYDGTQLTNVTFPNQLNTRVTASAWIGIHPWVAIRDPFVGHGEAEPCAHHCIGYVEAGRITPVGNPPDESVLAIWGTSDRNVWVTTGTGLYRYDGTSWHSSSPPVQASSLWGASPDDVWAVGTNAAHFDGSKWARVAGVYGELSVVAGSSFDDVWIGGGDGLWHLSARTNPSAGTPIETVDKTPFPPVSRSIASSISSGAPTGKWTIERMSIPISGHPAMNYAIDVGGASDGTLWFRDWDRVVEYVRGSGRIVATADRIHRGFFLHSLAPSSQGFGWIIGRDGVWRLEDGTLALEKRRLPSLLAISSSASAGAWAVAAGKDDALGHALVLDDAGGRYVHQIPAAAYTGVGMRALDDVWLVGGLQSTTNHDQVWPAGEGIMVHWDGRQAQWYRAPAAPLLAVAAVGPQEAWAVGAAGSLVHVKHGVATHHLVERAPWLRAIWASGPMDVWVGGDDGTLMHLDEKGWENVGTLPIGPRPAILGLAGRDPQQVWIASPDGILKVSRR